MREAHPVFPEVWYPPGADLLLPASLAWVEDFQVAVMEALLVLVQPEDCRVAVSPEEECLVLWEAWVCRVWDSLTWVTQTDFNCSPGKSCPKEKIIPYPWC